VLFQDGTFAALIDFDDANYTYLLFDLIGLIESAAWRHDQDPVLDFTRAREVIDEYSKYRPLNPLEKRHLFDVYKLSILFDAIWYFRRGSGADFYEKRKIDFLNGIGREAFTQIIFHESGSIPRVTCLPCHHK
jgi:Ser/Thr protein kinase RdoA (MazF antagonist)